MNKTTKYRFEYPNLKKGSHSSTCVKAIFFFSLEFLGRKWESEENWSFCAITDGKNFTVYVSYSFIFYFLLVSIDSEKSMKIVLINFWYK